MENGVREQVDPQVEVARNDIHRSIGIVIGRRGGDVAANKIDGLGELLRGSRLGALGEHPGGHRSDARHARRIIGRACGHQHQADGDRRLAMVGHNEDAQPIR